MQTKYEKIYDRVISLINKYGIPIYLKKWKKCYMKKYYKKEYDFIIDLNKCIKKYHLHTLLFYKGGYVPTDEQMKMWKNMPSLKYYPRKLPKMILDNNKIGIIKFYHYDRPISDINAEYQLSNFVTHVKTRLTEWRKKNLHGLILDFRDHTGGDVHPIFYSFSNIFNNSTLLAYSKIPAKNMIKFG